MSGIPTDEPREVRGRADALADQYEQEAETSNNEMNHRTEVARHVLWHNGDNRGQQPGSFTEKLLDAWVRADQQNAWRLRQAFPTLGYAVEISRTRGSDALAEWAGIA